MTRAPHPEGAVVRTPVALGQTVDKHGPLLTYVCVMRPVSTILGVPFVRVLAPMADVRLDSRYKVLLDI